MGLPVRKNKVSIPPTCPLSESMMLLRGAWAPNVIWYLSGGPRRFGELRHDIPRISARVLSARLRELESRSLVTRRALDSSPPSAEYALTELGRELLPAIQALANVGEKVMARRDQLTPTATATAAARPTARRAGRGRPAATTIKPRPNPR
jgi:DNA-binding HxlR family transcriptional regulator